MSTVDFQFPVEIDFTKRLEGRELQKNEFEFVLKDGVEVERVKNDAAEWIVFKDSWIRCGGRGKTYNYSWKKLLVQMLIKMTQWLRLLKLWYRTMVPSTIVRT